MSTIKFKTFLPIILLLIVSIQGNGQSLLKINFELEYGRNTNFLPFDFSRGNLRAPNFKFYSLGPSICLSYKKHNISFGLDMYSTLPTSRWPRYYPLLGYKMSYNYKMIGIGPKLELNASLNYSYAHFLYGYSIDFRPLNELELHSNGFINQLNYISTGARINYFFSRKLTLFANVGLGLYYNRAYALHYRAIENDKTTSAVMKIGIQFPLIKLNLKK